MPLSRLPFRIGRAVHRRSWLYSEPAFQNEPCPACGSNAGLDMRGVLWPELIQQWRLTPAWANWIDQREGMRCLECGSNLRSRQLAQVLRDALNERFGAHYDSLAALCAGEEVQALTIAEINSAGHLHGYLAQAKGLHYSEYNSSDPDVRSEDLLNLSYADASFDLVTNSDVLEHVPDIERALKEVHRVLKPGGLHIFTVPMVWKQACSRRRAIIHDGELQHLHPPSHHGAGKDGSMDFLVFYEFGRDFVQTCEQAGFQVELVKDARNPSLVTFKTVKT